MNTAMNMNTKLFSSAGAASQTPTLRQPNFILQHLWRIYASWILPLLLLLTLPNAVQAQFTFTTNNGTLTVTGYTGPGGAVTIPSTNNGLPVTGIGPWAFYSTSVANVRIPDRVTNLANGAFFDCESLTNVTIGTGITSIGAWAFAFCPSLTGVCFRGNAPSLGDTNVFYGDLATAFYLPGTTGWGATLGGLSAVLWNPPVPYGYSTDNGVITICGYAGPGGAVTIPGTINFLPVTTIEDDAFFHCTSLTSVTIGNGVTGIGSGAFSSCWSLTNVIIPSSVTNIGHNAFMYCLSLRAITVDTNNSFYSSVNGVLFDGVQATLIQYPPGRAGGSYTIPSGVSSIGDRAFEDCTNLTNVTIPGSVTNIGGFAFFDCTCLSVMISNGVPRIGNYAFYYCTNLATVTIPNSVTNIGEGSFEHTGLNTITIPNSVTSIGDFAFCGCDRVTTVTIPNSVTNIGVDTFGGCTRLTSVTIGNSVTSIGYQAFLDCHSIASITIPDSVTSIGSWAFAYCYSLTNVTIPNSVTSIGDYTFYNCTSLKGVYFQGDAPAIGSFVFSGGSQATVYYLPGTTGWDKWVSPPPAVLWQPQVQTNDGSFGVQTNQFGFNIAWASGMVVVVEACTDVANPIWSPVSTNTLNNGSSYFSDPQWSNYPSRLYRIRWP